MIQWPSTAITLIDAADTVPMTSIALTYTDPSDPTKTASVTLTRTPFLEEYIQGHPDHIDMPLDTFIAVRLVPENGVNNRIPCWIYGGRRVEFTPILDDDLNPVLDGGGYPTYTITHSGMPGPELVGGIGSGFLFPNSPFLIAVTTALDSPWGARAVSVAMSGTVGATIEASHHIVDDTEDWIERYGVNWFNRQTAASSPTHILRVPVNPWNFTRCDRLRLYLGGVDPDGYTNIRIDEARWEPRNRTMTFTSPSSALAVGMCLAREPGSFGLTQAFTQIAAIVPGESLTMAGVSSRMGGPGQRAYAGAVALDSAYAYTSGGYFGHNAATVVVGEEVVWGIYDWDTDTWSPGEEVIGEVAEILSTTSFRIKRTAQQIEDGIKSAPSCWYGTMWAHDGAVVVGPLDEALDIGADGYAGTPDGFGVVVS